jgi:hypothetical protein
MAEHPQYHQIKDTISRLEQAGIDPPKVVVAYHRQTDEQATGILEALDTLTWAPQGGTAGTNTVWMAGKAPGVEVNVFLEDDRRPRPESPMLTRVRNIVERHRG